MKPTQLKSLKLGDRVLFHGSLSDELAGHDIPGEVTEVGYSAVRIVWEDGVISTFQFNATEHNPVLEAISLV